MVTKNFSFIFVLLFFCAVANANKYPTYEDHYCIRDCSSASPSVCVYNFTAEWFMSFSYDCLDCPNNIDDCYRQNCIVLAGEQRPVRVVNRMLPGPKIQVCQNDMIEINVHNMLNLFEAITIHGHGIKQKGYQYMDGVGMLTQCPITPLTTFQYKYKANDRGTYWWHAHSTIHRTDGMFGPLIIREGNDVHKNLYDYDLSEHIISIIDMTKYTLATKYERYIYSFGDEIIDFICINGKGVDIDDSNSINPRAEFYVEANHKYRFRLISAGAQFCPFEFSIDNHDLLVIATDGNPIKPVTVKSIVLMSSERYDVVVDANQEPGNYWIKVRGLADCVNNGRFQTAILRYDRDSTDLPTPPVTTYADSAPSPPGLTLNPSNIKIEDKNVYLGIDNLRSQPKDPELKHLLKRIKGRVNKRLYITIDMNTVLNPEFYDEETYQVALDSGNVRTSPQFNDITFKFPNIPIYYQKQKNPESIFCNKNTREKTCPKTGFCACTHRYTLDLHDIVELILIDRGTQNENHPIHLHGHSFAVLGYDKLGDTVTLEQIKKLDKADKLKRNLHNPPFKDTMAVPAGGYVIVRFEANNPGTWFMHCHIDFHADQGMALIFQTGEENDLPAAPKNWPQCGNFKIEQEHDVQ